MKKLLLSLFCMVSLTLSISFTDVIINSRALESKEPVIQSETKNSNSIENNTFVKEGLPTRIWLQQNYSMEITNICANTFTIEPRGDSSQSEKKYDYVTYNSNGTLADSGFGVWKSTLLSPGQSIKLSASKGTGIYLDVDGDISSTIKKIQGPVFTKLTIPVGEVYEFSNPYTESITAYQGYEENLFDSVSYSSIGQTLDFNRGSKSFISFPARQKSKVTPAGNAPLSLYFPSDKPLNITKSTGRIIDKISLKSKETVEFINPKDDYMKFQNFFVTNNSSFLDIIAYNPDGSVNTSSPKTTDSNFTVNKGNRVKVTLNEGTSIDLLYPCEMKTNYKYSKTPAFERIVLNNGESFKIKRGTSSQTSFLYENRYSSNFLFDIAGTEDGGPGLTQTSNSGLTTILKGSNDYHITLKQGNNAIITLPSEYKDYIEKTDVQAIQEVTLKKGESYEFLNNTNTRYNIPQTTPLATFDYINMINQSTIGEYVNNSTSSFFRVDIGRSVRITSTSLDGIKIHIPSFLNGTHNKTTKSVFKEIIVPANKTLEIINNSQYDILPAIKNCNLNNNIRYNLTYHSSDGDIGYSLWDSYMYLHLNKNVKYRIQQTKGDTPLIFLVPSEIAESYTFSDKPVLKEIVVKSNEVYQINNNKGEKRISTNAQQNNSLFNLKILDSSGSVIRSFDNFNSDFDIPSGGGAIITPLGNPLTLYIPYQMVDNNNISPKEADVNFDNSIDILDLTYTAMDYNITSKNTLFKSHLDLKKDNIIDIYDLIYIARYL